MTELSQVRNTVPTIVRDCRGNNRHVKPNQELFISPYGVYEIEGVEGPHLFIESCRDRFKHITLWRMMDREGNAIWVDCLKVHSIINDTSINIELIEENIERQNFDYEEYLEKDC